MVTLSHDEINNIYGLQSNFLGVLQFCHSLPYEWRHMINLNRMNEIVYGFYSKPWPGDFGFQNSFWL